MSMRRLMAGAAGGLVIAIGAGPITTLHSQETSVYQSADQQFINRLAAGNLWFSDYGLQLSRQFRALKVWMSIKEHGLERFGTEDQKRELLTSLAPSRAPAPTRPRRRPPRCARATST